MLSNIRKKPYYKNIKSHGLKDLNNQTNYILKIIFPSIFYYKQFSKKQNYIL